MLSATAIILFLWILKVFVKFSVMKLAMFGVEGISWQTFSQESLEICNIALKIFFDCGKIHVI